MIEVEVLWNSNNAFAIKDANLPNFDIVDHWLAMNMATSMDEFKQAFKDYGGVMLVTMAAKADGQVFYIDDSTVPNLTETAIEQLTTNPLLIQTKQPLVLPFCQAIFLNSISKGQCRMKKRRNMKGQVQFRTQTIAIG